MDYPKSVEGAGLVDGKFVNENTGTGQPGSLIPAEWGNSVTDEILNVIEGAGLEPNETQVNQLLQAIKLLVPSMPTGMFAFFHTTDVPDGWLLCNGAAVSRTTYANLFAKIGVKYGSGDGSATFNLPNLDGRVLQGTTDTGEVGNYLEPQLPNIEGEATMERLYGLVNYSAILSGPFSLGQTTSSAPSGNTASGAYALAFDASDSNAIYGGAKLQASALQAIVCIKV